MNEQTESEVGVFRQFAETALLSIVQESIMACDPPEPDIRCRLESGEEIAFELVEICNAKNERFMASSHKVHGFIMAAYDALGSDLRATFHSRFVNSPLSFSFHEEASLTSIRNVLPALLKELVDAPFAHVYTTFSPKVAAVVARVRQAGRLNDVDAINFNLGGHFDPTVRLDAVAAKLLKKYHTKRPIELLAHFGGLAWGDDASYRDSLLALFAERGLARAVSSSVGAGVARYRYCLSVTPVGYGK